MQLLLCRRMLCSAWLVALAVTLAVPAAGAAVLPERPIKSTGFRLLARASGSIHVNQVQCGLISNGQICVDSTGSSTIPGSVWPKGTNNQYTFNSGISLAGIVGDEMPAWAGDTTGAFFFEGSGFLLSGEQVEPIFNASDPVDLADWPEFARVPGVGDSVSSNYDALLQGQVTASQGDVYFLSWDGNPSRISGRTHPMGVVVETRGLAWNFPSGNQDIIYFIYTLYNVSSIRPEDYTNIRQPLKDRLLQQAQTFQASNEAAFGVDIPDGGYSLNRTLHVAHDPTTPSSASVKDLLSGTTLRIVGSAVAAGSRRIALLETRAQCAAALASRGRHFANGHSIAGNRTIITLRLVTSPLASWQVMSPYRASTLLIVAAEGRTACKRCSSFLIRFTPSRDPTEERIQIRHHAVDIALRTLKRCLWTANHSLVGLRMT